MINIDALKITGTQVAYSIVCKRKLWLFSHGISMEMFSDLVEIGKIISETFFKREKLKEIEIFGSKIDFLKVKEEIIVHEIKKSKKLEEAHIWQTKFYIYQLQKLGLNCKRGIIHYPKLLRKLEIVLNEEDIKSIEEALNEIENIKNLNSPPPVLYKPYCKNVHIMNFVIYEDLLHFF